MDHQIKNFNTIGYTHERTTALLIAEAGLASIDTAQVVRRNFLFDAKKEMLDVGGQTYELKKFKKIICVGFGKCAYVAVREIQAILGNRIACGFVLSLTEGSIEGVVCKIGTHPLPSVINVTATGELMTMLSGQDEETLVVCVVSGGGSSLLCYPNAMSCEVEVKILSKLMKSGADIFEINTVRKHISGVKGGQLAKICFPATVVSLIFSDVPGNDLSMVASGPTVKDETTAHDAAEVLKKYNILELCELPSCKLTETPKEEKFFKKVHNVLVVSAKDALVAMKRKAEDLGYSSLVFSDKFSGDASTLFPVIAGHSKKGRVVLGAGETFVTVKGSGKGGRNQEAVLASLEKLEENQVFISIASDGFDNTDSAGAIADSGTLAKAKRSGLNPKMYMENNDSFSFFQEIGDSVYTGKTDSNVSDLFILVSN